MRKYADIKQEDTIYSTAEMKAMVEFNKIKIFFLHPIVKLLDKIGVTPNMISLFSAIVVISAFAFSYVFLNPIYFVVGIWTHMIMDALDGTLARYQNKTSSNGAIIDSLCDHFGIILACLFSYLFVIADGFNILAFAILYSILIGLIFYLLKNKSSFFFIIRPRLYLYTTITIDVFCLTHITDYIVLISSIIILVEIIIGFKKILSVRKRTLKNESH
jgi:phosphatidylglycerophosphate synthase